MKPYSANDEFRKLSQHLGFEFVIFDDPLFKNVHVIDTDKEADIDAFLYKQNIVCAVSITKSSGEEVDKQIANFFQKLDRIANYTDLNLQVRGSQKSNHALRKAAREVKSLNSHFKKYRSPQYNEKFIKLFFCPNRVIPEVELHKRKLHNEIIIDRDIFQYLMIVADRLPPHCLLNDFYYLLGVRKLNLLKNTSSRAKKPDRVKASYAERLEIDKNLVVYTLCPAVADVYDFITVRRIANKYDKHGFQRMVKQTRLAKISSGYLSKNKTFPNNIIAAMNPEFYQNEQDFFNKDDKTLTFFDEFNSLFIIDGQHRFYSFLHGNKLDREIILSLLFFKHRKDEQKFLEMDRMFYEINKKSERIDPNLAFTLLAKIDPESNENFWHHVFSKLLTRSTLFRNRFTFKETTVKDGDKKSIISVIQYGGVLKLNSSISKKKVRVPGLETYYGSRNRNQQIEFAATLIQNYFEIIETVLSNQCVKKEYLSPRDIGALLRLINHFSLSKRDSMLRLGETKRITKSSAAADQKAVKEILQCISAIDFQELQQLGLSPSNWAAVEGYLLKKINTLYSSFGNKDILSKKGLEIYNKVS